MSDKARSARKSRKKISPVRIIISLALTVIALAVFPVVKQYLTYDMAWYGGLTRLIKFMIAGVFFGFFPAVAAVIAVVERFNARKSVVLPAVIAASATWLVQYAIVLLTVHTGPAFSDATYGLLSAFCAAALALLVGNSKKPAAAS